MPIYTTYLGFINKHGGDQKVGMKLGSCFVYYVQRNRGNNEVAPVTSGLIEATKAKRWDLYEMLYAERLRTRLAIHWMEKRAGEAKIGNILLVCYEKDPTHCHRTLLAKEIAKRFDVEYKGELKYIAGLGISTFIV